MSRRLARMRAASLPAVALSILFACVRFAHAAVHVITADGLVFTPAAITIHQGDSIVFMNVGGADNLHNVHADDDSFKCSLDCSLHNQPSTVAWSSSVRFNRLGTIGYYCDQHGNPSGGMRGSIIVIDRVFVDGFDFGSSP